MKFICESEGGKAFLAVIQEIEKCIETARKDFDYYMDQYRKEQSIATIAVDKALNEAKDYDDVRAIREQYEKLVGDAREKACEAHAKSDALMELYIHLVKTF